MRFTTFFFSGTGNTWWVTREFSRLVQELGHEAQYYSLENKAIHDSEFLKTVFNESDAIGIAYPIYGSTLPKIMWQFLDELGQLDFSKLSNACKVGYTLTSVALFSGDGALVPRKKMKILGLQLQGAMNFQMTSNLSVPFFRYNPVSMEKLESRKNRNRKKMRKLILRLSKGKKCMEGRNPLLIFVGWLQRIFGEKEISLISKYWSVDRSKCTQCLLCVKDCPTNSIEYFDDKFIFHKSCTACMRCYNRCPSSAIQIFNRTADPEKYRRFHGPGEGFKIKDLR
ncbi:hypothetical protein NEF87_001789 [Candidatus Lokiarchaeum ossiferum]|uniref:4Fe-4S ferredoxin-type domain-containing protein n=1 Tax=Candidatus Lokiarchaeum ossiferum TaxID=2951803 RepID=A0ABY6HPR2_9ARCH|nr:hypothetical protein NEF87_001789 [Candidatus Lokiarchaeum sp. B-35]